MIFIGFPKRTHQVVAVVPGWLLAAMIVWGQAQNPPAAQNPSQAGTIRVKVGLVQTDVMVFDKQGHFVPDLKRNQFELRIDGKVQPIEFFEMVSAGSAHDREIWAKAENQPVPESVQPAVEDFQSWTYAADLSG